RQTLHRSVHEPPGQSGRVALERTRLRAVRLLFRVRADREEPAAGPLPCLAPGRGNDGGRVQRPAPRVHGAAESDRQVISLKPLAVSRGPRNRERFFISSRNPSATPPRLAGERLAPVSCYTLFSSPN